MRTKVCPFVLLAGAVALGGACAGAGAAAPASTGAVPAPTAAATSPTTAGPDAELSVMAATATAEPPGGSVPTLADRVATAPSGRCGAPADGTVTVWHGFPADTVAAATLQAQVERFEATHPAVQVDLVEIDGRAETAIAALAGLAPADRPDVVLGVATTVRNQADSGLFVPPSECTGGEVPGVLADLLPVVRHAYTVDGVLQAAPYGVSAPVMMYDRARWREAGLDPDHPPTTWDALFDTIRALDASGAVGYGAVLYDAAAAWLISHVAAQEGRLLVEPANGHAGTTIESVDLSSPGVVDTLHRFAELEAADQLLWAGLNEGGRADLISLVRIGDEGPAAGLTFHTSASLGDVYTLLAAVPELSDVDVGVAPLPGPAISPPGGNAWWLVDRGDPTVVATAWQLVEWLSEPVQNAELAATTGYAPTTPAAAAELAVRAAWEARPTLRVAYDLIAATPATDAAAGLQVGPGVEVARQIEQAAAWPIDAQADPVARLAEHGDLAMEVLAEYAADHPEG